MRATPAAALLALAVSAVACGDGGLIDDIDAPRVLRPAPNPFGPADPLWSPQPHRDKPAEVLASADGRRAYVALPGTVDAPGRHVAVVDVAARRLLARVEVGAGPTGLALHPGGRWLVVTLPTANYLAVVDLARSRLAHLIATDPYTIDAAFSPDGDRLVLSNRWRDAAAIWRVEAGAEGLRVRARGPWLPTGTNPRDVAVSPDGRWAAVGALTGLHATVLDLQRGEVGARVQLGAPSSGVAFVGPWLVVATLSASTHHALDWGPDADGDGHPGDGTPNVNFQDLQNELAVVDPHSGVVVQRATSDSLAGRDYRDVDPRDLVRGGHLLPPPALRIVAGALPEGLVALPDGAGFVVAYAGSDELQRFGLDAEGRLSAGPALPAGGHAPRALAVAGDALLVTHRLSETLGVARLADLALEAKVVVGDLSGGAFPATDVEIGELVNDVTAPFTVDGDQVCVQCHREQGNIDKVFSMPLLARPAASLRMTMAYRGAYDSRPWFHEAAMDHTNFMPVLNEFARIENFCCTDYTLWGAAGPPADCEANPPAACASAPNASSADGFTAQREGREAFANPRPTPYPTRDAFMRARVAALIGRDRSYGDGLYFEHPLTNARQPVSLDFMGLTRALGLFVMATPRLLPNPNPHTAAVERGRALFHRPDVGCAPCHAGPSFSRADGDGTGPVRMAPVVSPARDAAGRNLDLLAEGFVATFPLAEMDRCHEVAPAAACEANPAVADDVREVRFGAPPLRGLWDRAGRLLHHGAARSLREVLCSPGHPALRPGEVGRNERDGMADTHGGTSHLTVGQIEDLEAFLLSL